MRKSRPIRRLHPHAWLARSQRIIVNPIKWLLAALFALSACLPSLVAATAAPHQPPLTPHSLLLSTQQFAYATIADPDTYNIMLYSGAGNERRVAQVDIDGIGFSDVTARLSPNGGTIAFRVTGDRQGGSSLHALDVASGKATLVSATRSSAEGISSYLWSPSGNTLAFTRIAPAPYVDQVNDRYGSVYVYTLGGQAVALGGSRGSDRLLGFAGDGKGVYVSRIENSLGNSLEHLVYLPLSGGEATTLIKSRIGLRYTQFAVWAKPGYPAKVAAIAEGDFSLALPASPDRPPTHTPTATPTLALDNPISMRLAQQPDPTHTLTPEASPRLAPDIQPSPTPDAQPPTPDPLNLGFIDDPPILAVTETPTPEATPIQEEATATSSPTSTETATPVPTGVISHAPITGRLSRPNGLGIVVSDPAGTMPILLRRDAEAFSYVEWAGDGEGIMLGGTSSGSAWGVDMQGGRRAIDANLRDLRAIHWLDGGTAILADNPASRLVTLNFRTGGVVSAKGVGVSLKSGEPSIRLGVPYIHQVNDTSAYSNGNWACGPTSVAMALAYYGKLLPWGQYAAEIEADQTGAEPPPRSASRSLNGKDYAPYIANEYSQNGRSYAATARDASGRFVSGLYGTICPTGLASWQLMQSVLSSHDLGSTFVPVSWDGVVGALKRGHPVILGNELTAAGHIIVVIGYTADGSLLVNDPYGNRFESGYGGNYGGGILYPWKRATARRALEVIGTYPPPPPPPRPSRTPTPEPLESPTPIATSTPLPGIIPATPLSSDTPTPTPGEGTPTAEIVPGVEIIPPHLLPTIEASPTPYEQTIEGPTPNPFSTPESFFYALPLLLSVLTIVVFRRVRE